jgi:hypothetical protein
MKIKIFEDYKATYSKCFTIEVEEGKYFMSEEAKIIEEKVKKQLIEKFNVEFSPLISNAFVFKDKSDEAFFILYFDGAVFHSCGSGPHDIIEMDLQ